MYDPDQLPKPGDSPDAKPEPFVRPLAKRLAVAAWIAWLLSLALPAFTVESPAAPMFGVLVLPMGLLFGWMVFGWAAYANIFWWIAQWKLSRGKVPLRSVTIMLILALTIFGFEGVIADEGNMAALPVVSWGWGALLWGASLILLSLAAAIQSGWTARIVAPALIVMVGIVLALGGWGQWQRHRANLQEREAYLSWGMAFTVVRLSGFPLVWPDQPVVPAGAVVAFDIDPGLNSFTWFEPPMRPTEGSAPNLGGDQRRESSPPRPYLSLPKPVRVRLRGEDWVVRNLGENTQFLVRAPGEMARYVLQAREAPFGAVLRIVDTGNNDHVLYEQSLRLVRRRHSLKYIPSLSPAEGGRYGVGAAVERALGLKPRSTAARTQVVLESESATQPCDVVTQPGDEPFMGSWDGRQVVLRSQALTNFSGFCSPSYIALVEVREVMGYGVANEQVVPMVERNVSVLLFDRQTLEPLARFRGGKACNGSCPAITRSVVRGLQIDGKGLTVDTKDGNLLAMQRLN